MVNISTWAPTFTCIWWFPVKDWVNYRAQSPVGGLGRAYEIALCSAVSRSKNSEAGGTKSVRMWRLLPSDCWRPYESMKRPLNEPLKEAASGNVSSVKDLRWSPRTSGRHSGVVDLGRRRGYRRRIDKNTEALSALSRSLHQHLFLFHHKVLACSETLCLLWIRKQKITTIESRKLLLRLVQYMLRQAWAPSDPERDEQV